MLRINPNGPLSDAMMLNAGTSRSINFSDGVAVPKPKWSLAAVITVSILIALQIVGLCLIMAYAQSVPTWTENFDAFAMLRMGAELQRRQDVRFAGIRDADKEDLNVLGQYDGVVGVVEGEEEDENDNLQERSSLVEGSSQDQIQLHSPEVSSDPQGTKTEVVLTPFQLAFGEPGLITTSLAPRRAWRWKKKPKTQTHIEQDEV